MPATPYHMPPSRHENTVPAGLQLILDAMFNMCVGRAATSAQVAGLVSNEGLFSRPGQ